MARISSERSGFRFAPFAARKCLPDFATFIVTTISCTAVTAVTTVMFIDTIIVTTAMATIITVIKSEFDR